MAIGFPTKTTFADGNTLAASDLNDITGTLNTLTNGAFAGTLTTPAVKMYFADAAARTAAIPTPTEGITTYRGDVDALEVYNGAAYVPVNRSVVSYTVNTTATLSLTTTTETALFTAPSFTPITGRLYEFTFVIGSIIKTTGAGNITVRLKKDNVAGTAISAGLFAAPTVGMGMSFTKTQVGNLGSTAFIPCVTVQASSNGMTADNGTYDGSIIIKDIGLA